MSEQSVRATGGTMVSRTTQSPHMPVKISGTLLRLFLGYAEPYMRRHFHAVRLLLNSPPRNCDGLPLVVYFNHSAWWDPIVALFLARKFFPLRDSYGPIDADALKRYRFFQRLGLFGIEMGTAAGAKDFLRRASAILQSESNGLWITPQGKFADFHARPVQLQHGLGHLPRHVARAAFVPLAIQYVFWEERLPELLIAFGEPIVFEAQKSLGTADATRFFESALGSVQDHLASASQRRQSDEWRTISRGHAGANFFYDAWRKTRARLRGEKFHAAHSDL